MRLLWICNVPSIEASQKFDIKQLNVGGWLTGLSISISKEKDIELFYTFPLSGIKEITYRYDGVIKYIAVPKKNMKSEKYDRNFEIYFARLGQDIKPDIVHIFGTEYPHSLSAANVFDKNTTVISIQGMTSIYAMHYFSGLPIKILKRKTLFELIKKDSIFNQRNKFMIRGNFENQVVSNAKYIVGRTEWDKACTYFLNPKRHYFHCNETLRDPFYLDKWSIEKIERYSIFISQATSPIKGFHHLLDAVALLIRKYPNIKIYVSGIDLFKKKKMFGINIKKTYTKYILSKITSYELTNNITFVGSLNENEMKERFLKSNVFVSPSSIENSPNSLGEAMILGIPSISSFVGGVPTMLEHGIEGFLYQYDAPYMLAHYIDLIFSNDTLATQLSQASIIKAEKTHSKDINAKNLIGIYKEIINKETTELL